MLLDCELIDETINWIMTWSWAINTETEQLMIKQDKELKRE